jgi:SpoVK/Ycf46/Vps4 family AAA+-type ATPase
MDPAKINNYNQFLSTLDQNANNIPNTNLNHLPKYKYAANKKETELNKNEQKETIVKNTIDTLIDNIHKNFKSNLYYSYNFTGENRADSCCANNVDPNYYKDKDIKSFMPFMYYVPVNRKPLEVPHVEAFVPNPELINIEAEINNISDILALIEKYKVEPTIKYNINMKALHNIKEPLEELNNMIGMKDIKSNIIDQILYFVQELHKNNNVTCDFMHTVIYGPPGTGKTEIAKIMGKIYSKIGILKKGTFKKVTRSDLIAGYLGQTSIKTSDAIKDALGGVLFIDEAYALGNPEKRDSFAKECIDTLCEALSDNKEDLMVIIAGYEKELKDCFFNYNQGLDSRFIWRFKIDEYGAEDLYKIFIKKVKDIGWTIDGDSKIGIDWFKKNKDYFKFYGRDIETILAKTKIAHSRRVFCKTENEKKKINLKDLDKGFELYLKNEDVKNRMNELEFKKELYNTIYS